MLIASRICTIQHSLKLVFGFVKSIGSYELKKKSRNSVKTMGLAKIALFTTLTVILTAVIMIFSHISIPLQTFIYGLTYSSVNSKQIINIRASLRLWEGLHVDQLKSLQVHLTQKRYDQSRNGISSIYERHLTSIDEGPHRRFNDITKQQNVTYSLYVASLIDLICIVIMP